MEKSIDEKSQKTIRTFLDHKSIKILKESWVHSSDVINFITMF